MSSLLVIAGSNTLIHSAPFVVHAPVDQVSRIKSAILVEGATTDFHLWQDVSWYFMVDVARSCICQRPGVDLTNSRILVLLE